MSGTTDNYRFRVAMVDPQLPHNEVSKLTFKINSFTGSIAVGLCHLNIIAAKKYEITCKLHINEVDQEGRSPEGAHLMKWNGWCSSHGKQTAQTGFRFDDDHVVEVQWNPAACKVDYSLVGTKTQYTQIVDRRHTELGPLHFCIAVNSARALDNLFGAKYASEVSIV